MARLPQIPGSLETLGAALRWRADQSPDNEAYVFLRDLASVECRLTYADLDRRAQAIAACLRQHVKVGDRVLLSYPPGLEFVAAFFGALYAGLIAVPVPPYEALRRQAAWPRLLGIVRDAGATAILSPAEPPTDVSDSFPDRLSPSLQWLAHRVLEAGGGAEWTPAASTGTDIAYLQYTSGSTGAPKGAMIAHRNLLLNCRYIADFADLDPSSSSLTWMPNFHDYGLVQGLLFPLLAGIPAYVMSAVTFLKRPIRWLEAISRHRVTIGGAPNFAYDYCVRKTSEPEREHLDLSPWRVASCGAEPVRWDTIERFTRTFSPYGFQSRAFAPAYGLAEATLLVSCKPPGEVPEALTLNAQPLEEGRIEIEAPSGTGGRVVTSCGRPVGDFRVAIVSLETGLRAAEDRVGEIWLTSSCIAQGYWDNPEATRAFMQAWLPGTGEGPFFRTGDLGFLHEGALYVTGRLKDMVILQGRNLYPQDIEQTAEAAHPSLRRGGCAAFSLDDGREESLIVVQEVERRTRKEEIPEIVQAIRRDVSEAHDAMVQTVVLIHAGGLAKTSSGKVQRGACKELFIKGALPVVHVDALTNESGKASGPPRWGAPREDPPPLTVETSIRSMLGRLLAVPAEQVDMHRPLAGLGIDSLRAAEMLYEIETQWDVHLSLATILSGVTAATLAETVKEARGRRTAADMQPCTAPAHESSPVEIPLSANQSAVWVLAQLAPASPAFNTACVIPLDSPVDAVRLEGALRAMARRHPMLRTTYRALDGTPLQQIHDDVILDLGVREGNDLSWDETKQLIRDLARHPLDLVRGPCWRAHLIKRSEDRSLLLVVAHHIGVDGKSMQVVVEELGWELGLVPKGDRPESPTRSYLAYAEEQRAWLERPEAARAKEYWTRQISQVGRHLDLPYDETRGESTSEDPAQHDFALSDGLSQALRTMATREETTLYVLLMSALQVLLWRYGVEAPFLIATPINGRQRAGDAGTIGHFVNVALVRGEPGGPESFRTLVQRVHRTVLGAYEHQGYPYAVLCAHEARTHEARRDPFTPVMFALQPFSPLEALDLEPHADFSEDAIESGRAALTPYVVAQQLGQFDLTVEIFDVSPLRGSIQYTPHLFAAGTIAQISRHYLALLDQVVSAPDRSVATLPILQEDERTLLLDGWGSGSITPTLDSEIDPAFARQVARTPDATALCEGGLRWSYRELDRRAGRLARRLRQYGVGPETVVGILLERSPDLVIAMLATFKAGGAFLPIDPGTPMPRMRALLEDIRMTALVTDRRLTSKVTATDAPRVHVDEEGELECGGAVTPEDMPGGAERLAYAIYTSGTTGKPKGVLIEQRALANYIVALRATLGIGVGDRVLQFASPGFDTAIEEIFVTLLSGATLVLNGGSVLDTVEDFLARCRENEITVLDLPTAYWHEIVVRLDRGGVSWPAGIRTVIIGGEQASQAVLKRWFRTVGTGVRLWNTYGPSEVTIAATLCDLSADASRALTGRAVPIGRPIHNVSLYVLDRNRQPVPPGATGELYIGGQGVMRGYTGAGTKDAGVVRLALVPGRESRLYPTGDKARWRRDGFLEVIGRLDDQVKLRGYRIEPEDVERTLQAHPFVESAAVAVREELPGDRRLVAFVVARGGATLTTRSLREHMMASLPAYMVPSAFIELERLPLTIHGKVDRSTLQAPLDSRRLRIELSSDYVPPRTAAEQALAEILGEVLQLSRVGVYDNFFELGGHSLLATQVASRIRSVFEVEIPLRTIFEQPTIHQLSLWLSTHRPVQSRPRTEFPIERLRKTDDAVLSYAQERMWFLYQLAPGSSAYNIPLCGRLVGPLHREALQRSLQDIVARHDVLRTNFVVEKGRVKIVVHAERALHIADVDLRLLRDEEKEQEAIRIVERQAGLPFDLATEPLWRMLLIRVSPHEHLFLAVFHHIICDQWSLGVMSRELVDGYNAAVLGREGSRAAPRLQYVDYAKAQRVWLEGPMLQLQLGFWKHELAHMPALMLPTDFERPREQSFQGAQVSLDLPRSVIRALAELGTQEGATLYMTCLTAFVVLLARLSGQRDFGVGSPIANRHWHAVEEMIGSFVNTLVLRVRLADDQSFRSLLRDVRDVAFRAYAHQDVPFEKLVEELRPGRETRLRPLAQVLFNFANAPFTRSEFHQLSWTPFEIDRQAAQFDLSLTIEPTISSKAFLEYSTDLFERATATRFLEHYLEVLKEIVSTPDASISRLNLLTERQRRQLITDWNETQREERRQGCFIHAFEDQVETSPHAVAVTCGGHQLTYRQLNARANQLAHYLRALGVKPEVLVGVCVNRSSAMLVALLGIMKAGGAYVPLDPTFPGDRLDSMLDACGATILVTESAFSGRFAHRSVRTVWVDRDWDIIGRRSEHNPHRVLQPRHRAYVIFTSGSTGVPKGVEIEQHSLANFLWAMASVPGISRTDVWLAVTTIAFDIAGLELYGPLLVGGRVVIAERTDVADGARLAALVDAHKVTILQATPATWRALLAAGWQGTPTLTVLCGGEALPRDLCRRLIECTGALWNMYGPTETTIWSTVGRLNDQSRGITIGRPIANTQVFILDQHLQPVPIGVTGELYIGGDGVARGYLNRPDLSAERFIVNPLDPGSTGRLYRTGDFARFRADGDIEYLGRIDGQVKIRGFRIEIEEVEAHLGRIPGVQQAVVAVRQETIGTQRLVGYVVPSQGASLQLHDVRAFLRRSLPEYMVPSAFQVLNAIPLTPNGKVDRAALPDPATTQAGAGRTLQYPRTALEMQLVALWEQMLGVQNIGIDDNYFDLGGHSLLAVHLFSSLEAIFGKRLPLATLFQAPTIKDLAQVLQNSGWEAPWQALVAIQPLGTRRPLFAVPGVGGNVLVFARLAKLLGTDQPFYGLQARGLDGRERPETEVSSMATRYLGEVRRVQPEGPYWIAGTCTGGVVAYEMAQQLRRVGQEVRLFVIETWHPNSLRARAGLWPTVLGAAVGLFQRVALYARSTRDLPPQRRVWDLLQRASRHGGFLTSEDLHAERMAELGVRQVVEATFRAVARYRPTRFPGRIVNIVASERDLSKTGSDTRLAWGTLATEGHDTYFVPAQDSGRLFVEPHVHDLAARLIPHLPTEQVPPLDGQQRCA